VSSAARRSPRELVLRAQAILRRGGQATAEGVTSYGGGALVIDEPRRLVTLRGELVDLTPTEWVLVALATGAGPGVLAVRADQPGAGV
jgi:DNA-binding response OmpR family regulator